MRSSSSVALALLLACSTSPATAKKEPPAPTQVEPTPEPPKPAPPVAENPPVAANPDPIDAPVATDARTPGKKDKMTTKYDDAVKLLAAPTSWCTGAKQLVALKDKRALVPLVQAYEKPVEADKLCLSDAMEALGAEAEARKLITSKDATERRIAIRLMILFGSDEQLAPLNEVALHDSDTALRTAARDALRQQRQTKKWEEVIATHLDSPDDALRGWAIDLLIKHNGKSSWQRVQDHLPKEKNAELRTKIETALAHRK
jgi:hypothetical protein